MSFLSLRDIAAGTLHEFELEEVRLGRDPGCELVVTGQGAEVVADGCADFPAGWLVRHF